ncbi:hypothetical protein PIB19_07975 [Sphingomonas sp. 7/4-4]|uniref:hypothetical protein n=1 Tax=Sphingomonas sp. 7/4-4 TaxID=3018446 RepID=UPI0022F3BF2A|nr:hypothetical protein [Sphingomonas sp. 7/4-4]WBY09252.1 hypothetical protein PIB19_07975 [Sphingomonas sp. 7/4-4]
MSRSNWGTIAAVIGCLAFGYGVLAGTWASQPGQHRDYPITSQERYKAETALGNYVAHPIEEATDCYQASDHDKAGLCVQWRATIATEKAANAAIFANYVSASGAALSFIGIVLVLVALGQTRKGNRIAEQGLKDVQRAFVSTDTVEHYAMKAQDGSVNVWQFYIPWKNTGQSPATSCVVTTNTLLLQNVSDEPAGPHQNIPDWFPFEDKEIIRGEFYLGPGSTRRAGPAIVPIDHLEQVFSGRSLLFFFGRARYKDVFGRSHETRFCIELTNFSGDPADPVGPPSVNYRHWKSYNCADEDCRREDLARWAAMPEDIKQAGLAAGLQPPA